MSDTTPRSYRVVTDAATGATEQWFDDLAAAHRAIAAHLGVDANGLDDRRRRVNADPLVVRRDGARWRSGGMWIYRSGAASARLFEMVRVDEAAYDH